MSFNFKLKNTNVSCTPMYNSQNPKEVYGYLCNPQRRIERFQDVSSTPNNSITLITNNGYNATGESLSRYSSDFTQIFFDSRTPVNGADRSIQQGQVTSPLPTIGSIIEGPFVQPGTRVTNVEKTNTMPGNPYVPGYTVTLSQPLTGVNETLGPFLAYTLSIPPLSPGPIPVPPTRVRVPTEPFNPSTIEGLQIWLDSADESTITLSGGNISSWMDKSGNSNNFSVAPTFIPPSYKNINSGVSFTSKQVMISSAPVTTNNNTTVFFVGNVASRDTDFDYILAFAEKDHAFRWNPRNNFGDNNSNDFAPDTGYIVNGQPSRVKYDFTKIALVNFVVANGGTGQLTLSTNKTFGGDRFFKGVIYELLIFNSPLSTEQTQQIQTYLLSKWNLPGFATGYTCPPGMLQTPEDLQNGNCLAPCESTRGGSNIFNYGPKYGGYPTNRRSGADRCIDLNNGSDQSQAFATRVSNWPPLAGGDPSCFLNGQYESAGMKLYTQADCENVVGGNYYPTDHTPGYGECLYPEGGSHSYTCRRQ